MELIVRKRIARFIKLILRYQGYDFNHDRYKGVIYNEIAYNSKTEEMAKRYYDAYCYLLNNSKNPLTTKILSKFFYLLEIDIKNTKLIKLVSLFFKCDEDVAVDKAILFHLEAYKIITDLDEAMVIALMLFNYTLVKNDHPSVQLNSCELTDYEILRDRYYTGDKKPIYLLMLNVIRNNKYQEKSYYLNLKPLNIKEIYNSLINDKEMLKEKYQIKSLAIYGSYAKGNNRIDSDIDMLVSFNDDLLMEEKLKNVAELESMYYKRFNRFVDILEVGSYISDEIIEEITKIKKVM